MTGLLSEKIKDGIEITSRNIVTAPAELISIRI
jgi:hypothetical protein